VRSELQRQRAVVLVCLAFLLKMSVLSPKMNPYNSPFTSKSCIVHTEGVETRADLEQ